MAAYIAVLYCVFILSCVADDADCRLQHLSAIVVKRHYYYSYYSYYSVGFCSYAIKLCSMGAQTCVRPFFAAVTLTLTL